MNFNPSSYLGLYAKHANSTVTIKSKKPARIDTKLDPLMSPCNSSTTPELAYSPISARVSSPRLPPSLSACPTLVPSPTEYRSRSTPPKSAEGMQDCWPTKSSSTSSLTSLDRSKFQSTSSKKSQLPTRNHDSAFSDQCCNSQGLKVSIQAFSSDKITMQVKNSNESWTVFRSWQDCWILHIHLMSAFPDLVGNDSIGRQMPILPIEYQDYRLKQILEFYFERLICLLENDLSSIQKFLEVKGALGDYKHSMNVESLSEFLSELDLQSKATNSVTIKVSDIGRAKTWTEPRNLTYSILLRHASRAFGKNIKELYYQNEFGDRAKLVCTRDLMLLVNAREKCKFYTTENGIEAVL